MKSKTKTKEESSDYSKNVIFPTKLSYDGSYPISFKVIREEFENFLKKWKDKKLS